jgi:ZIP family zinc transporter
MSFVWISAAGLCGATLIGSLLGFLIKELPHMWNDATLGYCAGVMLAAATLALSSRPLIWSKGGATG